MKNDKAQSALTVDQYTTRHNSVNCTSINTVVSCCVPVLVIKFDFVDSQNIDFMTDLRHCL